MSRGCDCNDEFMPMDRMASLNIFAFSLHEKGLIQSSAISCNISEVETKSNWTHHGRRLSQLNWTRCRGIYSGGRPEVNNPGRGEVVDLWKHWKTQLKGRLQPTESEMFIGKPNRAREKYRISR